MKHTIRSVLIACVAVLWAGLALFAWLKPPTAESNTERRKLAQFPAFSSETVLSGKFMTKFEDFATDQFPFREPFRKLKASFHYNILNQKDNNSIYLVDGIAAKLEYPLNVTSVDHALTVLNRVYDTHLKNTGCNIYQAVIPDKSYYLAEQNGYPAIDYDALLARMDAGLPWAATIDLTDCLSADDYYRTDTHWRQERLFSAAQRLCNAMDIVPPQSDEYTQVSLNVPFYGVYYGQAAIPMKPDKIQMLQSSLLNQCTVYNYENEKTTAVYDMNQLTSRDLYDVYLSGAAALLRIDNPNAATDRELVVFRDSFGSSLVPLLVQGYRSVTLVDLRYISSSLLGQYVSFDDQDVLFLYSTLVLNNSTALK